MSMNIQHGSMAEPGPENSAHDKIKVILQYFLQLHEILTTGIEDVWGGKGYAAHASAEKELYEEAERIAGSLQQSV